jgi:ParB family chromosome partitioning protein
MRLLALPDEVKQMMEMGSLSAGHARALLGLDNAVALAREIAEKGLNVRQAERLAKSGHKPKSPREAAAPSGKDADCRALEHDLTEMLGLKVSNRFSRVGRANSPTSTKPSNNSDTCCNARPPG